MLPGLAGVSAVSGFTAQRGLLGDVFGLSAAVDVGGLTAVTGLRPGANPAGLDSVTGGGLGLGATVGVSFMGPLKAGFLLPDCSKASRSFTDSPASA